MRNVRALSILAAICVAAPAFADALTVYPVQTANEQVRFRLGVPTLTAASVGGSVQITPVAFDHGNASFGVAVFNQSGLPANFGIENISISSQGQQLPLFSREQLQQKAQNRATWARIGTGVATALAASAAGQEHNTYVSRFNAPGFSAVAVYKDYTPGAIAQAQTIAAGGQAFSAIQQRLDFTLDHLAQEIVQTTTVDPGTAYGGRVVIAHNSKLRLPYDMQVIVLWNGTRYPFTFRVTKAGQNVPPPFVIAASPVMPASLPAAQPTRAASAVGATYAASTAPQQSAYRAANYAASTPSVGASANQPAIDEYAAREAGRRLAQAQLAASGAAGDR